jgi:5-methylcytosine-specific restriction endonuclease McrBC regulatory subunit McrC
MFSLSIFDPPDERILANCLQTIAAQTEIIQRLVASTRELTEALDIATKENKKLKEKQATLADRAIA